MEAVIFSLFQFYTAKVSKFHYKGIKRKMRFLHQLDFSRIGSANIRRIWLLQEKSERECLFISLFQVGDYLFQISHRTNVNWSVTINRDETIY